VLLEVSISQLETDWFKELVIKPVKLSTKKMVIATQIKRFNAVKTARVASL
jgi:hypothetical protein